MDLELEAPRPFERITIIGLGLIGSSIARAAHKHKLAQTIVGCDTNEVSMAFARKQGFIDVASYNAAAAVMESQLVIIATPPITYSEISRVIAPKLAHGVIVMDTASVKRPAMEAIARYLPMHAQFVPTHPIAGSEQSGVSAGRADLFKKKRIIVTPDEPLQGEVLEKINSFWQAMGARVEGMPPHIHDMVYAYVSHLPQFLAFASTSCLAGVIQDMQTSPVLSKFMRLGGSNPGLWGEIFEYNKDNLLIALNEYLNVISHVHDELIDAPDDAPQGDDDRLARSVLFPRIAASCLITTIMQAERKAGFPFARYAGTGLEDFTAPATQAPDADIEQISHQSAAVAPILRQFIGELASKRQFLA